MKRQTKEVDGNVYIKTSICINIYRTDNSECNKRLCVNTQSRDIMHRILSIFANIDQINGCLTKIKYWRFASKQRLAKLECVVNV